MPYDASHFATIEKLLELLIVVEVFRLGFDLYTLFRIRIMGLLK